MSFSPEPLPGVEPWACLVFAFLPGGAIVCNIRDRGWTIPSGRVEPEEDPESCARRELLEEAGAICERLVPLGQFRFDRDGKVRHSNAYLAVKPEITQAPQMESLEVKTMPLSELPLQYAFWNPLSEAVFEYALFFRDRSLEL